MSKAPLPSFTQLSAEKVAYWYFRLNGFLQIENFVVHPNRRGSQRTDADLLAVRFPYRAERLYDDPNDIMADDEQKLALSRELTDVVIAEVKANQPCTLNGPWTRQDSQNIHRVLSAIGCLPRDRIDQAATAIYRFGIHVEGNQLRIRLVALGREPNSELSAQYPSVIQAVWSDTLAFIWERFRTFRNQKTQVDQWDVEGRRIKRLADEARDAKDFTEKVLRQLA
jgi:hypothetical protein